MTPSGRLAPAPADGAASHSVADALFVEARAGDAAAADQLCRILRAPLFRAAYGILRNPEDADDVAQETLVRAFTHRFLWGLPRSVEAYCIRAAVNLAKNRGRDRRRRHEILREASVAELTSRGALAEARGDALSETLAEERRRRADLVVARLPARQQDIVRLRLFAGLTFSQIAAALRIREDAARVTFSQAKKRLIGLLADEASDRGAHAGGQRP